MDINEVKAKIEDTAAKLAVSDSSVLEGATPAIEEAIKLLDQVKFALPLLRTMF